MKNSSSAAVSLSLAFALRFSWLLSLIFIDISKYASIHPTGCVAAAAAADRGFGLLRAQTMPINNLLRVQEYRLQSNLSTEQIQPSGSEGRGTSGKNSVRHFVVESPVSDREGVR